MRQHIRGRPQRGQRTTSTEPLETISLQLRAPIAEAIRAAVRVGEAPNASTLVEDLVKERLRERRRQRVYAAYAEASQDPVFMAEMAQLLD